MSKAARKHIADVLAESSLKRGAPKKFTREVAAYLLDEGRTGELDSLLRDIQADWAEAGYVEVFAVSAHPLTAKVISDARAVVRRIYPKARKIIITEQYDPTVIGGVRLELANQQLDLSIQAKLNKFKQLTTDKS